MQTSRNRTLHRRVAPSGALLGVLSTLCLLVGAGSALAQDAPGGGAVHGGAAAPPPSAPASAPGGMPERKPFTLKIKVKQVQPDGTKAPMADAAVLVDAMASMGGQGTMKVRTYNAKTDAQGVASLDLVGVVGATYVPKVLHDGVNFTGAAVSPSQEVHEVSIDVFGKTFDDKDLLVTELMTTVDLWEGYLILTQMWTFSNAASVAFDPTGSPDEKYAEGMPIVLPKKAMGINAMVIRGQGVTEQARVVENKVLLEAPIPPMAEGQDPLRVQLRYSMPLKGSHFDYEQQLDYKVEGMRVIVPLQTRYNRHPRLNLTLDAPGFPEVGDGRRMPGMAQNMQFVVARDGHADPGGKLSFSIDGLPAPDTTPRWVALILGVLMLLGGVWLLVIERRGGVVRGRAGVKSLIRALTDEREDLFDALRDLDERYDEGDLSERRYDIEAAKLRERLALVMRRLERARDEA